MSLGDGPKVLNEPIPGDKFDQFHQILCNTGGRYIAAPRRYVDGDGQVIVRVSYIPGDQHAMQQAWKRLNQTFTEERTGKFRCLVRRIRRIFSC